MTKEYKTIQIRRDTLSDFASINPILASGEPACALDTFTFKIGNGSTPWNNLPRFPTLNDISSLSGILHDQINVEIANLIDGAPEVLDTLNEIANAIDNDENFAVNIFNNINTVSGIASPKINGSGTSNYLGKWLNNNTLTNSIIYESGNIVGIGGASTGSKLYITSNNPTEYASILSSGGAGQELSLLRVSNSNSSANNSFAGLFLSSTRQGTAVNQGSFIACVSTNTSVYTPNIVFGLRTGETSYAEHMRISSSGNIGIGNNAPVYKLDVTGTGNFTNVLKNGTPVLSSGDNIGLLNNNLNYISNIVEDTSPQLGSNLDLNNNNIIGTGSLNINGSGNFASGVYTNGSPLVKSDITGISGSASGVYNLVIVDQITFDNISIKDPNTIYYIL